MRETPADAKEAVRRRMIALRRAAPPDARRAWSHVICRRVCESDAYAHASDIVSYLPIGAEVDPGEAAEEARRSGRRLYYADPQAPASLRPAWSDGHPADVERLDDPHTLILVPGVAFDRAGNRLGRGAGWYDRLLPRLSHGTRWGLAFALQLVDSLPVDPWDVPMDAVITERARIDTAHAPHPPEGTI